MVEKVMILTLLVKEIPMKPLVTVMVKEKSISPLMVSKIRVLSLPGGLLFHMKRKKTISFLILLMSIMSDKRKVTMIIG